MKILIPIIKKDRYLSIISSIEENSAWAVVELDVGKIVNVEFYDRYEDVFCLLSALIVINNLEFIWPLKEDGIKTYCVSSERSIDEIIESFLLNRLKEI